MRRSSLAFLVAFAGACLLCAVFALFARLTRGAGSAKGGGGQILSLRLEGEFPDQDPNAAFHELLGMRRPTLHDTIRALDHAATDPTISALELRVGTLQAGWARAQELRAALLRFRAGGKPVHAFLELADDGTYFLASAADHVRLLPSATLWLDGIGADVTFFGGTLGKVGVQVDLEKIGPYKNAADVLERASMTDEHREAMGVLMDGLFDELVAALAESLDRSREEVEALLSAGPYSAHEALQAGLVDALGYEDETAADLDAAVGRSLPRVKLDRYLRRVPVASGGPAIALVHCAGTIASGESMDGILSSGTAGGDTIARAIRTAREDGARAIVLRVDSPGGSATASDVIWRETMRTREAGIPVIVSMSDLAASGGYWVSMGADHVIANPSTITGSIGIYGGKYVLEGLHERAGLGIEPIERGANAGLMSSRKPFTDAQREWLQRELRSVYRLFLERTASGRGFESAEAVDRIAQGRVWTGRQALELGLVDELGGLDDALERACGMAGLPTDGSVPIRSYPRPPTLLDVLRESGAGSAVTRLMRAAWTEEAVQSLPLPAREALQAAPPLRLLESGVLAWTPVSVLAR